MLVLLLSLIILGLIIFVFVYFLRTNKTEVAEVVIEPVSECCGAHTICQEDTLLSASNIVTYYDDEELDEMANVSPADYTNVQLKLLADVFFSLKESDTAGWLRSLQMRNIQLPNDLREQALLIIAERRMV